MYNQKKILGNNQHCFSVYIWNVYPQYLVGSSGGFLSWSTSMIIDVRKLADILWKCWVIIFLSTHCGARGWQSSLKPEIEIFNGANRHLLEMDGWLLARDEKENLYCAEGLRTKNHVLSIWPCCFFITYTASITVIHIMPKIYYSS